MRTTPESSPFPRLLVFPLVILAALLAVLARLDTTALLTHAHCRWREITGCPCPTCGGTHAVVALAQGRWSAALAANPLVVAAAFAVTLWALAALTATLWPDLRRGVRLGPREKRTARWLVVLLLSANWLYEVAHLGS